jgi:tetratricopeptide (TPR) repeat protein
MSIVVPALAARRQLASCAVRGGVMCVRPRHLFAAGLAVAAILAGAPAASAGEVPLYRPVPAWVIPAPPLDSAAIDRAGSKGGAVVVFDQQIRIENGMVQAYIDKAVRADAPEALAPMGTISGVWSPDMGDLIVHRAVIMRGSQTIDLLAGGRKFTVLQREQGLERRVLDGSLTATFPVSGLQVGDVLRFSFSVTRQDKALRGHVQDIRLPLVAPVPVRFGRIRVSWPKAEPVQWKIGPKVAVPPDAAHEEGADMVFSLPLPLPKRDPMPEDAPSRFRRSPLLQIGDFADWADVSRIMAPLFRTEGTVAPGSPIAREVAAIMAATPEPRARAARALELVQSRISYLLLGMNGGNYVPQTPAETWDKRYGDCKAKTVLLLAMLRMMGIEAEAVMAASRGGDALPESLPIPGAFDHVLVRAVIAGRELWLDGTGSGSRLADLNDVPALFHVLPVREAGADLTPVTWRQPERPGMRAAIVLDQRAGIDLPTLVDAVIEIKGGAGASLALAAAQAGPDKQAELAKDAVRRLFDDIRITQSRISGDQATGITTIRAQGLTASPWRFERAGPRLPLDVGRSLVTFVPNRARPAWRDIPLAVEGPGSIDLSVTVKLPDAGQGYRIEGAPAFNGPLGGVFYDRNAVLEGGQIQLHIRRDAPAGAEIAPAAIAAEKIKVARYRANVPLVRGARTVRRFWEDDAPARTRFAALDGAYAAAIARKPDEAGPYVERARFRRATFDRAGAYADFAKALSIEPSVAIYSDRIAMLTDDGRFEDALADALAALDIDPAGRAIAVRRADLLVKLGRKDEALAARQDALDVAGNDRPKVVGLFAEVQSDAGETREALAGLDEAMQTLPGNPDLLNQRCWIKATLGIDLESALKDCTRSIELASQPAAPLDSRGMVYFRMGRMDEALADFEAALEASPGQAGSLFMRGVIRARTGQSAAARADIAGARRLSPGIDRQYAAWGIKAPF